ncbi:7709_t:CDS:2, partial [Racocetra fulgida]
DFISVSHKDKRLHHLPSPRPPPLPISKRAYVKLNDPPDVTNSAIVFWETPSNKTIIVEQFSSGFIEEDSFDKIFKIRPDGATDAFLFVMDTSLVTGNNS